MPQAFTTSDLEAIRQAAADRGDCDLSRLANQALWGTDRQRAAAKRKLAKVAP